MPISDLCYDIQTWSVQFTDQKRTAKQVTKNWNWPFLISHYQKPPVSTLLINLRWSEARSVICRTELYSLQTRKKSEKVETVQIKLSKSKTQLKQFNDQQKVTKNVTWAIYRPHKKPEKLLERWNWTFHKCQW